jgi:hypothetical protein
MAIARGIGVGKGDDKHKADEGHGEAVGCLHVDNMEFDTWGMIKVLFMSCTASIFY